jgi:prepilin-type N-terminal cleavage/methylation domain-containing protein
MRRSIARRSGRGRRRPPAGFTLVELLVVITIIGMLMAIIFPALNDFLAKATTTQCTNNLREISSAILQKANSKQEFPGYVTTLRVNGRAKEVTWVVVALEVLNGDTHKALRRGETGGANSSGYLKQFVCPADPVQNYDASLSYVANTGRQDTGGSAKLPKDWPENGVFMRESVGQSNVAYFPLKMSRIADGAGYTLMLSENIQATYWTSTDEAAVGFVWFNEQSGYPSIESRMINNGKEYEITNPEINYARPSSNHPGGVVVSYCDGRATFLSEKVKYSEVYCKLMTPDGDNAKEPGGSTVTRQTKLDTALLNP